MKGVILHCPNRECKKVLALNVRLKSGDGLKFRCFNCGELVDIQAMDTRIVIKWLKKPSDLTDDEEDGIIFIHS